MGSKQRKFALKKITVALRRFKKNKNDTELVNKTAPENNVHDLEGL